MNRYRHTEITPYGEWSARLVSCCMGCSPLFWVMYWVVQRVTGRWRYKWVEAVTPENTTYNNSTTE